MKMANLKPLFLTIYAAVIVVVIFSSVYVFSVIYWCKPPHSTLLLSNSPPITLPGVDFLLQAPNTSTSTYLGASSVSLPKPRSTLLKPIWQAPPRTKKMPPLESFHLTRELLQERVESNTIIVTFGNYAFLDFILTWVKHLTDLGLSNMLVGAMDTKLLEELYWKGIPVFNMESSLGIGDLGWRTKAFEKLGREKVILINSLLSFGYEFLMCDTDMVWFKNPLPYFARYPEADILTSTDQLSPTVIDERLDVWQKVSERYNIGIFLWRPTESSRKLAKEWKEMVLADENIWDQDAFFEIVQRQLGPSVDAESGLVYAYDGNLKLGFLPATIFCNGHTYFVQAIHQQLKLEPYAVHTTFQYAGIVGKRHRLREAMAFYDPPEYYNSPGGFLTFEPSIPKRLLLNGAHNIESHFALVNYQIKQIRTALAITLLLNRTLVMPRIWCRLDRLWFGHSGVIEGTMTRQPFVCPLDHVFEVHVMLHDLPEEEFGPHIGVREYSFFDNPALPKEVKESRLDVQLCQLGSRGCKNTNNSRAAGLIRLPKHSSEEMFRTVFSSFKNVKVIKFLSMRDAFLGFTDKVREHKFRNRVTHYVGKWCCVKDYKPGHIYYDMYWDEKPGWKPLPVIKPEDDESPL